MDKGKNVHIIVKESTKKKINNIRVNLEKDLPNRVSNDEVVNVLIENFTANSKNKKQKIG